MSSILTDEIERLRSKFLENPTIDNLVALHHVTSVFAHERLIDKANEGSTMAVIELAKMARLNPKINSYEDLSKLPSVSKDDMQVYVAQLQMKMRNGGFKELNVETIKEAYVANDLTYQEFVDLTKMIECSKRASTDQVSGQITVMIDKETNDAL